MSHKCLFVQNIYLLLFLRSYTPDGGPTVIWAFPEYANFNCSLAKIRNATEQAALDVLVREISKV